MSANTTSGNHQSYDHGHGIRIFQELRPSIVAIQEFNFRTNSSEDIRRFVDGTFGKQFSYFRETEAGDSIPNGIISLYPIVDAGEWRDPILGNRGYAWAKIELPQGRFAWVYSLHFSAGGGNKGKRAYQAQELVRLIKEHIPNYANEMILIGGDLNTTSKNEEAIRILQEIVGDEPDPMDPAGNPNTNANRNKRYDWAMASDAIEQYQIAVDLRTDPRQKPAERLNFFPEGLVFDTRSWGDFPFKYAKKSDSSSPGMQHMAVIKDFLIK
jgi:endonuclease/exonuclease/phosphatase family metal-dependent hydrolase